MHLRGATLHTKHSRALAVEDQMRPLFTLRTLSEGHGGVHACL